MACMEIMCTLPKLHSGDDPVMLQHQPMHVTMNSLSIQLAFTQYTIQYIILYTHQVATQ